MPTIRIELFEGRSAEQKAALAREVTEACVRVLGGSPGSVDILSFDIKKSDWATRRRAVEPDAQALRGCERLRHARSSRANAPTRRCKCSP